MKRVARELKRHGARWSEPEVAMLLALHRDERPLSEIADKLSRTYGAVAVKLTQLKQRAAARARRRASGTSEAWPPQGRRAWPEAELERLEALVAAGLSNADIARALHRTIISVEVRRSRIRVRERALAK